MTAHERSTDALPKENRRMGDSRFDQVARFLRPTSRLVGLYHTLLRQQLMHFFPDATLEVEGDRGAIQWTYLQDVPNYRLAEQSDGVGLSIEWLGTTYQFYPGRPAPFRASERRLIEVIIRYLDTRFEALMDVGSGDVFEGYAYAMEDLLVTQYLDPPYSARVPAVLEALRVAALTTYEDHRVSSGALLLGTEGDPAFPGRVTPEGAPRYHVGMAAIKSLHRICDGMRTIFVVDRKGHLAWAVDAARWVERARLDGELPAPCPRRYLQHARATLRGQHVCLVLSPSQEIKVFARGVLAFTFANARWRLMDVCAKFGDWGKAIGADAAPGLAARVFRAAMNLAEERTGALLVVLRDPDASIPQLLSPGDRIHVGEARGAPSLTEDVQISPRLLKRVLHQLVIGESLGELDDSIVESLAGVDGALVTDRTGRLHSFGAILRITSEAVASARAAEGARTVAAVTASFFGPVLKVSQDGIVTMYLSGRRVWDL